jgi:peptide/nickel transport system substrate-binding protein
VRRAVYKGTNLLEFQKLAGVKDAPLVWQPVWPGNPAYIPLKDLPKDIQTLYEYDAAAAKKMLADAGYPNGFKTGVTVLASQSWQLDQASLLKDQWAKLGIDVEIHALDNAANQSAKYSQPNINWDGLYRDGSPTADPVTYLGLFLKSVGGAAGGGGGLNNYGMYSNKELDPLIDKINRELDPKKRNELLKQADVMVLRDPPAIPLAYASVKFYWWPWLKNYYGEESVGDDGTGFAPLIYYAWIDQNMKTEMGFK